MKTRQTRDASPTTSSTNNTNSSAPLQATMTSSSPTVKNRQTGDQKRARYGQARNLPEYQRDTNIKKVKIEKQGGAADLPQAPKPDGRWVQSAKAMKANDQPMVRAPQGSDTSELVMASHNMGDAYALEVANFLQGETELALDFNAIDAEGAVALAKALKGNTTLTTLTLSFNLIGEEGAVALAEALKGNTTLTTLHLNGNAIGAAGAVALAEALKVNTTLTTLHLVGNAIGADGAVALVKALKVNTTLTTLHLNRNAIGAEGAIALAEALKVNTTLKTLHLGGNTIGAEGAVALAEVLKGNTILTTLDLFENAIGAKGAVALAEALRVNTILNELNLGLNAIDEKGAVALANALKFNTNLRTLDLMNCSLDTGDAALLADALRANTTLTSLNLAFNSQADWEIRDEIEKLLEKNRQRKENLPYAEASLDLLVRHSPALKNMGFPTDVIPVLAEQLPNEVMAVFAQEWEEIFRAPAPPITTTTTTTDSTIPTTLISSPAPIATSPALAPTVSTQPTATADDIKALLADPNPVAALSRWINGHANPTAALNWIDPSNGYTLLHYAVEAQQGAVVRSLLARPIDRTRADQNNQTAAQLAQQRAESSSSSGVAAIAALFK